VRGVEVDGAPDPAGGSSATPDAIAAVLLALRDATGVRPQRHFEWSEGTQLGHLFRYLILGRSDTAPVVREILRTSETTRHAGPVSTSAADGSPRRGRRVA
jgi:hypothetical protein